MKEMISDPTELAVRESQASYDTHKALVASHEVAENKALVSTAQSDAIGGLATDIANKVTEDAGLVRVGMSPDVPVVGPRKFEDRSDIEILADTNDSKLETVAQFADDINRRASMDQKHVRSTQDAIKADQKQARKRANQGDSMDLLRKVAVKEAKDAGVEINQ